MQIEWQEEDDEEKEEEKEVEEKWIEIWWNICIIQYLNCGNDGETFHSFKNSDENTSSLNEKAEKMEMEKYIFLTFWFQIISNRTKSLFTCMAEDKKRTPRTLQCMKTITADTIFELLFCCVILGTRFPFSITQMSNAKLWNIAIVNSKTEFIYRIKEGGREREIANVNVHEKFMQRWIEAEGGGF